MPEIITHTTFAYLIRKRNWDIHFLILFLLGAMLPDLLTRPFTTFFKPEQFYKCFSYPISKYYLDYLNFSIF